MSIVLGVFLIVFGMYILYVLSSKQIEKTKKSKLHFMTQHINILRLFACLFFECRKFVYCGLWHFYWLCQLVAVCYSFSFCTYIVSQ